MAQDNKYSPPMSMTRTEQKKWISNMLIFLIPVLIIYLTFVLAQIQLDGFQWSDFTPNDITIGSIFTYLISTTLDFLRKFVPENFN